VEQLAGGVLQPFSVRQISELCKIYEPLVITGQVRQANGFLGDPIASGE
jgi:hypothetical protein